MQVDEKKLRYVPKFDINDRVIFFDRIDGAFVEGYIMAVSVYVNTRQLAISYDVGIPTGRTTTNGEDEYRILGQVSQSTVFKSRKEAMEWINNVKVGLVQ